MLEIIFTEQCECWKSPLGIANNKLLDHKLCCMKIYLKIKYEGKYNYTVIKPNLSLYALYYAKACNEFTVPISVSLRPGNAASFEGTLQR